MDLVRFCIFVIFVIVSIFIILLVLIQDEQGDGIGGVFGGGSSSIFGAKSSSVAVKKDIRTENKNSSTFWDNENNESDTNIDEVEEKNLKEK